MRSAVVLLAVVVLALAGSAAARSAAVQRGAVLAEVDADLESSAAAEAVSALRAAAQADAALDAVADSEAAVDAISAAAMASMSDAEVAEAAQAMVDAAQALDPEPSYKPKDDEEEDDAYPNCGTCVKVLEAIKDGAGHEFGMAMGARPWHLPTICNAMWKKHPDTYGACHQTLHAVRNNGRGVHYWLTHGCYEKYVYGQKHWIHPCPSRVICAVLRDFRLKPFCGSEKRVSQYGLKSVNNEKDKEDE